MPRHSREDAPDEQTYERLFDAACQLDEPFQTECRFILVACGRLGLRAGEVAHIKEHWVDWDKAMINVPRHEPCHKGQGGDRCGYCYKRARSRVRHADASEELTLEDALAERWEPKTPNSARAVPFDYADWIYDEVERFFWFNDGYEHSRVSINRRVTRITKQAGMPADAVYPHCLRAAAGTFHSYRGLQTAPLKALMGWKKLEVAEKYIRNSGGATARALKKVHQD